MQLIQQLEVVLPPFAQDVFKLCVWLVLLLAVFVPLERLCALRRQKIFRASFGIDLGYYFLNSLLPKLLLILPLSLLAGLLHGLAPLSFYAWVDGLPFWLRLTAAILVGEIGAYWGHRWMHQSPLLWRFHAVHHSAEELDWLVNTRAHPLDLTFTRLCGLVPIYVLGLAQPGGQGFDWVPLVYALFGSVWGFFIHANLRWRFGVAERLISTPGFHHWHHTRDGNAYVDKNYAAIFPFIDQLFGTLHLPRGQWPTRYGIDTPIASGMAGQLLQPFVPHSPHRSRAPH